MYTQLEDIYFRLFLILKHKTTILRYNFKGTICRNSVVVGYRPLIPPSAARATVWIFRNGFVGMRHEHKKTAEIRTTYTSKVGIKYHNVTRTYRTLYGECSDTLFAGYFNRFFIAFQITVNCLFTTSAQTDLSFHFAMKFSFSFYI